MENKQYSPRWEVDFSNPNANNITTGTTTGKPMQNKQQTAIDWFFTQILGSLHSTMSKEDIDRVLEQAKEMETEQSTRSRVEGYEQGWKEANEELQGYVDSVTRYDRLNENK